MAIARVVTNGKNKRPVAGQKKNAPTTKRQRKDAQRAERKQRRVAARQRRSRKNTIVHENKHFTRPELMRQMLQLVASWFLHRQFLFVADSLYTGESVLRYLPTNMNMIGAVRPNGAHGDDTL